MEFIIIKEVDGSGTWYWTIPERLSDRIIERFKGSLFSLAQKATDVWLSERSARRHIKRWNNGYYKKKYYSKKLEKK